MFAANNDHDDYDEDSDDDDGEGQNWAGAGGGRVIDDAASLFGSDRGDPVISAADASHLNGFRDSILGNDRSPKLPKLPQNNISDGPWITWDKLPPGGIRPVRTLCWNIPIWMLARDATRFMHATTSSVPRRREQTENVFAILSLLFAGTAKGVRSGRHSDEEDARSRDDERIEQGDRAEGERENSKKQENEVSKVRKTRASTYSFYPKDADDAESRSVNRGPMFILCAEQLFDKGEGGELIGYRVWKLIFDHEHSDTLLVDAVMNETRQNSHAGSLLHCATDHRRPSRVQEQEKIRIALGGKTALETDAALMYLRICDPSSLYAAIRGSGDSGSCERSSCLPAGCLTDENCNFLDDPLKKHGRLGGRHILSPEVFMNPDLHAARANCVDETGEARLPTREQLDSYFATNDDGEEEWAPPKINGGWGHFFICVNTWQHSIFDLPLPQPRTSAYVFGARMREVHRELHKSAIEERARRTGTDVNEAQQQLLQQIVTCTDSASDCSEGVRSTAGASYDSLGVTAELRKSLSTQRGKRDPNNKTSEMELDVQLGAGSCRLHRDVVSAWIEHRKCELHRMEAEYMDRAESCCDDADLDRLMRECKRSMTKMELDIQEDHVQLNRELFELHASRLSAAYESEVEKQRLPNGYRAVYDAAHASIAQMDGSAQAAFWYKNDVTAADLTPFGHARSWIYGLLRDVCLIEGRDLHIGWCTILHAFEIFARQSFILQVCGPRGTGKTTATKRIAQLFPDGWVKKLGTGSEKRWNNGHQTEDNGSLLWQDEADPDILDARENKHIRNLKEITSNRVLKHSRSVQGEDGHYRTHELVTPCLWAMVMHSNYGPEFTANGDVPRDEAKLALVDRSVSFVTRMQTKKARTDDEFASNLQLPHVQRQVELFRFLMSMTGLVLMLIKDLPALQPDLALASRIFSHQDSEILQSEYNFPEKPPRKTVKGEYDILVCTVMNAVVNVFFYQSTAVWHRVGRPASDGSLLKFRLGHLWDVIRIACPTMEICQLAYGGHLHYDANTAIHGFQTKVAICEWFGLPFSNYLRKPPVMDANDEECEAVPTPPNPLHPMYQSDPVLYQRDLRKYQHAVKQRELRIRRRAQAAGGSMSYFMTAGNFTRQMRRTLASQLAQHRRATNKFRQKCQSVDTAGKTTNLSDPQGEIERIMHEMATSMEGEPSSSEIEETMGYWTSALMPTLVELSTVHDNDAVSKWLQGHGVPTTRLGKCGTVGVKSGINFKAVEVDGLTRWDTTTLSSPVGRQNSEASFKHAAEAIQSARLGFCEKSGLTADVLKDNIHNLASAASRCLCTQPPYMDTNLRSDRAFFDGQGLPCDGTDALPSGAEIFMRSSAGTDDAWRDPPLMPPRHADALVPDSAMQRQADAAILSGRFPAMMPIMSPVAELAAPVTLRGNQLEANYAVVNSWAQLNSEAALALSVVPGFENEQEEGVQGLGIDGINAPPEVRQQQQTSYPTDEPPCTKLPYSNDIVPASVMWDISGRIFYSSLAEYGDSMSDLAQGLGVDVTPSSCPQYLLPFLGLNAHAQRHISYPIGEKPRVRNMGKPIDDSEPGDCDASEQETDSALASICIGQGADAGEVRRQAEVKKGRLCLSGIKGDLYDISTMVHHNLKSSVNRGMVVYVPGHREDEQIDYLLDQARCLQPVIAHAAAKRVHAHLKHSSALPEDLQRWSFVQCLNPKHVTLKHATYKSAQHVPRPQVSEPDLGHMKRIRDTMQEWKSGLVSTRCKKKRLPADDDPLVEGR